MLCRDKIISAWSWPPNAQHEILTEGGLSLDSRSADKEQKAVTPEKSKVCITTFAKKVGA